MRTVKNVPVAVVACKPTGGARPGCGRKPIDGVRARFSIHRETHILLVRIAKQNGLSRPNHRGTNLEPVIAFLARAYTGKIEEPEYLRLAREIKEGFKEHKCGFSPSSES